jgi:hypothetical protein
MAARKKDDYRLLPVVCGFGCGKPADGSLSVHWSGWRNNEAKYNASGQRLSPDHSMSFHLPACWECARGSVDLKITLPKKAGV